MLVKVMMVEDDPMVLSINHKFLAKFESFQLINTASDLEEAKEKIRVQQPDLLLLDVFLPSGKGVELLKWIRLNNIDSDIIFITADKSSETLSEAMRFGAIDYLVKPFTIGRFGEALNKYLAIKEKLDGLTTFNQATIDGLSIPKEASTEEISTVTLEKVLNIFKNAPDQPFSASMIAKAVGVSRITARRYLDELEQHKVLSIQIEYGQVGRPKNMYVYTTKKMKEIE